MKAITLHHPWAYAVAHLGKDIENREWTDEYAEILGLNALVGQRIAIHGGTIPRRGKNQRWLEHMDSTNDLLLRLKKHGMQAQLDLLGNVAIPGLTFPDAILEHLVLPGIVAVAVLGEPVRNSESPWAVKGQLHIPFLDVKALPVPVAAPGQRGFWDLNTAQMDGVKMELMKSLAPKSRKPIPHEARLEAEKWLQ